jgi:uncharacterized repeat protein (TIGR02059 family)
VQQPNGINPSRAVPVTASGVADAGSGVATVQYLRSETTLTGSTCGTTWSSFQPVTLTGGKDTSVQDSHCYRYQLVVTDNVGNVETDTSSNVVEIPDLTPPSFASAATDAAGAHLTLTMSEALDASSVPSAGRFVVYYDGVAQPAPTSVQVVGSTVVLGLASPPNDSQTVTVSYDSDGSLRDLATPTPNATPSFGPVAVTNDTPDTVAPSPSSASVDGTTLTLRLDEAPAGTPPAPSAFAVTVGGVPRPVSGVSFDGRSVVLTLNPGVANGDTVLLRYAVPALDGLHDAAGNPVASFTTSVANATAAVAPPQTPVAAGPALLGAQPADGATVASTGSFTLTADRPVTWTQMTLTRPDGTVTPLPDASGAAASWAPGTAASGLYVVRGTISAGGRSTDVLTHFTVWAGPASGVATAPGVAKNAGGAADTLVSADGAVTASWTAATFGDPVVVQVVPQAPTAVALPSDSTVVDVTAFLRDSHVPVTQLGDVLDIQFRNAPPDATPEMSQDGRAWASIASLPTLQLPAGQREGWFRDSDGTVHVLTRHLTYYALLVPQAATKLAMSILTPRRLWLDGRTFMAVRILVTAPARVTGSFVAADGTVIPGQVIRTPTRRAGATILRVPLHVTKPGVYRLQVHADGIGQVVDRTARIRFLPHRPASPIWQSGGPLRVAVVRGVRIPSRTLAAALGGRYVVRTVDDADLYAALDPNDPHAAAAVVVDLATVPLSTLASLHTLLPELRIIGLTTSRSTAAAARLAGVRPVLQHAGPGAVHALQALMPRR